MRRCNVCGKWFSLKKENRYEISAGTVIDAMFANVTVVECFDCPRCGCQNVVNERIIRKKGKE